MIDPEPSHPTEADTRAELTRLWLKSLPVLEAFIRGMVQDRHAREDVLQATAEEVSRSFDTYDRSRPFSAWIIGIARYRVLTYYRTQQRDKMKFGEQSLDLFASAAESISDEIEERMEALEQCLSRLDPKHRKLIRLRYVEDLKPKNLAEQIGSTPNSVSAMIRRVRLALAGCIEKRLEAGGRA